MKSYCILKCIRIDVDDSYKWNDTLFFCNGLAENYTEQECEGFITLKWVKKLNKSDMRSIGEGSLIGNGKYVDEKYGIKFEMPDKNHIMLTVEQEANEWLIIAIELLLLKQDKTLIHAAAVEKAGNVILLPSWGGVGKTAIVCGLIRNHGWKLLGDDLVIIDKNNVYGFLKPFVIYPYHKNLFPELFSNNKKHTVKNLTVSRLMSKAIPSVKRILRHFPFVLAYLRKHNPQSMRVSPREIFSAEQLSVSGKPYLTVWLDRCNENDVIYHHISREELASRAATVSSLEIFAEKLNAVYQLCGCGIIDFDNSIQKIYGILIDFLNSSKTEIMQIPLSISIESVADVVYSNLSKGDVNPIWLP